MPAWIAMALRLLAQGVGFGVGLEVAENFIGPLQPGQTRGPGTGLVIDQQGRRLVHVGGHRRSRRRRALTASDRADIAFIASMLGKPAGKDFAVTLAARGR